MLVHNADYYILLQEIIPVTALGELHTRLGDKPFAFPSIVPPEKYVSANSNHTIDVNLHDAAYDAYITGWELHDYDICEFLCYIYIQEDPSWRC